MKIYLLPTLADIPDAPLDVEVSDITRRGARLHWSEPKHDGGSPIQGYHIERKTPYSPR